MSDDEEMAVGGGMGADEGFAANDSDEDMVPSAGESLPDGIKKEISREAEAGNWKKPRTGDEVTVHYVGTLESDGSLFDSSRDRGDPFVFTLGKGQVIKGWDLGVATMRRGEVAKFTLAPEFAYGDAGSPPKIPEKATLVFEVELLSWVSKDDLFGDEGVIKTQLKEGSGWKTPKAGDEVRISFRALSADGGVIEDRGELEYAIGSGVLGPLTKAADKALTGMKKGESASLRCSQAYMPGDAEGTIELALLEIFETRDCSLSKDKSLMKKQVKEGQGWDTPKDAAKVTLSVEAALDGTTSSPLPGFSAKVLEFTAGNGEVCDALECAVLEMKKGERAVVTCGRPASCAEAQLGLQEIPSAAERIVFTLELTDFQKAKDTWSMSEEEKIEFGAARKEVGSQLFKASRTEMALERYKKVLDLFSYTSNFKDENKGKAEELKRLCELNKAACHLRLSQFQEAKKACDSVLKEESENTKAHFRHAQAEFGLGEFASCIKDCKRLLEQDPQSREARDLLKRARAGQKEQDEQAKGMFVRMCKRIGRPVATPARKGALEEPACSAPPADAAPCTSEKEGEAAQSEAPAAAAEAAAEAAAPVEVDAK